MQEDFTPISCKSASSNLRHTDKAPRVALSPHEERLLKHLIDRNCEKRFAEEAMNAVRKRFSSLPDFVSAPAPLLLELPGVNDTLVDDCRFVLEAAGWLARGKLSARTALSSHQDLIDYLRLSIGYAEREKVRILFLNRRHILISDEMFGFGTIDHVPLYVREVICRSLELGATSLILCHNHPSGDPTPSRADISLTKELSAAGKLLNVEVLDHILVARNGFVSMKAEGLF
jgi:DNA repair protein RadC